MIKTMLDAATRNDVIHRIMLLQPHRQAQWGKMNVYTMTKHCTNWDEWVLGKNKDHFYRQALLGKIFGKIALKGMVKDDTPLKKGMPSGPHAVKKFEGDLEIQKAVWIKNVAAYEHYHNPAFVHDFFGVMSVQEIGILAYKHADHHLRQFGV